MSSWYALNNEEVIHSPALLIFPELIKKNICIAKDLVANRSSLRPHVKTHKISEVAQMFLEDGIDKFKCATIAEAEMLAIIGAKDILLAYQPSIAKSKRLLRLAMKFPGTVFSCLIDNLISAENISKVFENEKMKVFIDINVGMNRTGVKPQYASALFHSCENLSNLELTGLHVYDGHIHHTDLSVRKKLCDEVLEIVNKVKVSIEKVSGKQLQLVMGGSPTFHLYSGKDIQTSPGTFVFWDEGYRTILPDLKFHLAAVLLVRVISIIDETNLCLDLGHKAIASENPLPRVKFLNVDNVKEIGYSEEHLVVNVKDTGKHAIGDVWYGVPYHICPTVSMYNVVHVIENNIYTKQWKVIARDRAISI